MQLIKCKYVFSTVHFLKIRYSLSLLESALYSKWNQIKTDIWKAFFCKAFFCLCMRKRCPFCLCAGGIQPV